MLLNIYFKEMKKFFSLIALVGVIAACTPEQVDTAFKLAGGSVTVNVEVVDLINGGLYAGSYKVTTPTIQGLEKSVSGTHDEKVVYAAGDSKPVLADDYSVTVSGPNLAKDYSAKFAMPAVLAGGEAVIRVIVPVGEPINGWTPDYAYDFSAMTEGYSVYFLANNDYPKYAYSHGGIDEWYYNNTEYLLEGEVLYNLSFYNDFPTNVVRHDYLGFEGILDNVLDYFTGGYYLEDRVFHFFVSAWAMWNVTQTDYWMKVPFEVFVTNDTTGEKIILGTFDFTEVTTTAVEPHEIPYPLAPGHAHYVHGYGRVNHGEMPNAGGGISYNE